MRQRKAQAGVAAGRSQVPLVARDAPRGSVQSEQIPGGKALGGVPVLGGVVLETWPMCPWTPVSFGSVVWLSRLAHRRGIGGAGLGRRSRAYPLGSGAARHKGRSL